MKFKKGDIIKIGNIWECIIADDSLAVFGMITKSLPYEKEKTISFDKIFVIDQIVQDAFKYKICVGIYENSGAYVFENDNYDYDKEQNNYYLK